MTYFVLTENQIKTISKSLSKEKGQSINESVWGDIGFELLGIVDPTGIVDIINGVRYFTRGDYFFGTLSFISAFPILGDVVAKPVMGALRIGGGSADLLKKAEKLAAAGKTAEAAIELEKVARAPGVVGSFIRKASTWAPDLKSRLDVLPGGIFKGFRNTVFDWLTLLERAGAKSTKLATEAGMLAKTVNITKAQQLKNINELQNFLKTSKVWDNAALSQKGTLSQIFLGGAPRLLGDRRMRILLRQTKYWLGFLDWVGIVDAVSPEEAIDILGGEEATRKKVDEYNKTEQAKEYASEDFPDIKQSDVSKKVKPEKKTDTDITDFVSSLFSSNIGRAALALL
jgi:hypothetical protein